jgi:hypothetical protein
MAPPQRLRSRPKRPTLLLSLALAGAVVACSAGFSAWSNVFPGILDGLATLGPRVTGALKADLGGAEAVSASAFDRLWTTEAANGAVPPEVYFAWADPSEARDPVFDVLADLAAGGKGSSAPREEVACLANAVYFEARGENRLGRLAVAQVVLNRVKARGFPKTVCGVVYQNADARNRCQFSFACDGAADRITDRRSWREAVKIARDALADGGRPALADIGNSTHYHATYAAPNWAERMDMVDIIGGHVFYAAQRRG